MNRTALALMVFLAGCKGGNDYSSMARQANAARGDAGGSEVSPAPPNATLLGSGNNSPTHLRLEGDTLSWLNEGGRVGTPGLFKVGKGGGATATVLQQEELAAMASDANAIYFLAPHTGKIGKVSKAGGTPEVLAETTSILRGLAIDDNDVFWAENEAIMRVPKAGGKAQTVIVVGLPDFLQVDGSHVYWYSTISGVIQRAPKKGGSASKVYADDQHTFHTLFVDGPDLFISYGAEKKGVIQRLPKSGGKPVTLCEEQDPGNNFAVDAKDVYWITEDDIFKVPRSGGAVTKVVAKLEHGRDLVVDDRFVYWTDRSGRIQKLPK